MCKFNRGSFDFEIPEEVEEAINNLENAVITNSTLLDCYLEELRAIIHFNESDEGLSEDEANELIDYYYRRKYSW